MEHHWQREYWRGGALALWREGLSPALTSSEADFLEAELGVSPGARLLDAPCGEGRHLAEFAARGYRLAGLDLSDEMLSLARGAAAAFPGQVALAQGDLSDLPWREGAFAGAYCFGNSFGSLDRAGTRQFFAGIAAALRPGARFVLDTAYAAESVLTDLQPHVWWEAGPLLVLENFSYHPERNLLEVEQRIIRRGVTEEHRTLRHWIYTVGEIVAMLEQTGFRVLAAYSSREREPFRPGAPYLVLVGEQKGISEAHKPH